ncbi:MAG: hypothetical protein R2831_06475 [Chitinophagaceae bacterium]
MKIEIPNPCNEDFNEMPYNNQSYYCSKCQHQVADFTAMNDTEIIAYIRKNPFTTCGRFRADQLNREISIPAQLRKRISLYYYKVAAFLAFMFGSQTVKSQLLYTTKIEFKAQTNTTTSTPKISGYIDDRNKKPLHNVAVVVDKKTITTTNEQGYFEMLIDSNFSNQNVIITIKYNDHVFKTFSYNKNMGSLDLSYSFDTSEKEFIGGGIHLAGAPSFSFQHIAYPNLSFEKGKAFLHKKMIEDLNDIAQSLRANPSFPIKVLFYKSTNHKLNTLRQKNIIDYLVDKQGIDRERLIADFENRTSDFDKIIFTQANY